MKTAEQWADELVERLTAKSMHVWPSIMADVIREAMADGRKHVDSDHVKADLGDKINVA